MLSGNSKWDSPCLHWCIISGWFKPTRISCYWVPLAVLIPAPALPCRHLPEAVHRLCHEPVLVRGRRSKAGGQVSWVAAATCHSWLRQRCDPPDQPHLSQVCPPRPTSCMAPRAP